MKIDAVDPTILSIAIQGAQAAQQQTGQPHTNDQNQGTTSASVDGTHATDKVSIQLVVPRKTLETLQQFGQVGDFLNNLATNLRKTQEALGASAETINKMKSSLDEIIKNYPPYNLDSEDRKKILMTYSGLRQQITSLTVPTPPEPVYEKVKHLWQNLFSQDGTIPAHELPVNAPDSHVDLAAKHLDSTAAQVGAVREALNASIKAL